MAWFEIKTQSDIDHLLERFGYFHDGCLREMHVWTGTSVNEHLTMTVPGHLDTNAKLFFQRQFNNPSAIELLFEGVTGIHITPSPENYDSIIRDAVVLLYKETYYWADAFEWHPEKQLTYDVNWIAAKKLKWREVSDWMGPEIRYGVTE